MLQCLCGKSLKKNKNPSGKSHCVFFFPSMCADLQSNLCSKSVNAGKAEDNLSSSGETNQISQPKALTFNFFQLNPTGM